MAAVPLTWSELDELDTVNETHDEQVNGPTNPQARLRLFGHSEEDVRVTLYRDNHAWCPYCQKVWLWLEEKKVPYRVEKVTMNCYGKKEAWYKSIVQAGMLPAIYLDGILITESDDIVTALEGVFDPLTFSMQHHEVMDLRRLERLLFRAWCTWLCHPARSASQEQTNRAQFIDVLAKVGGALSATPGPYFLKEFSVVDILFAPYLERINASIFYYKGYSIREQDKQIAAWFNAMETRSTYRGTQSDFHTHVHDLPPQMGGCWDNGEPQSKVNQARVDHGPWLDLPDVGFEEPDNSRMIALHRMLKHRKSIIQINPIAHTLIDEALRCALTYLITNQTCTPPKGSDVGLRYLRDRINVPRDMSIYGAKRLRMALEVTAALVGDGQGPPIDVSNRYDQNPAQFKNIDGADQ
eukprot:GHVN01027465.1.p1 GENE.GHVN01027465.1~~GHVN01027465.1.p1  ORF type:complete len:410 (+),score=31.71 GHVN01027465.1:92-1321(+)